MLKIGEFAHLSQVTVRTLRYYDEIGLLRPAHVDPWTGYRYYSQDQLSRLHRILTLKDLGLSLEQIEPLLDDDLPPAVSMLSTPNIDRGIGTPAHRGIDETAVLPHRVLHREGRIEAFLCLERQNIARGVIATDICFDHESRAVVTLQYDLSDQVAQFELVALNYKVLRERLSGSG